MFLSCHVHVMSLSTYLDSIGTLISKFQNFKIPTVDLPYHTIPCLALSYLRTCSLARLLWPFFFFLLSIISDNSSWLLASF